MASIQAVGLWMLVVLSTALGLNNLWGLFRNYQKARKVGVPIRIVIISPLNPIWMLLDRRVLSFVRRLPFGLGDNSFTRYNWRGWEVEDRCKTHEELGDAFILCSSYRNTLQIGNPDAVVEMLRRSKDFPHDAQLTGEID